MILVSDIQAIVAHEMRVPVEAMREPDGARGQRAPDRVLCRQAAMALALELTSHGPTKIGRLFGGRNHATVIHAKAQVENRRACDEDFDRKMRRLAQLAQR